MPRLKVLSGIQSSVSNSSGVIPASRIMLANSFGWRILGMEWHRHTLPRIILVNFVASALAS